jgi:tetratricopeptide (TPR) repeat protein
LQYVASLINSDLVWAQVTLKTLLKDELLLRGATEQLQHLKYLALKNLAEVLAQQPERAIESLEYYECASKEEEYIQVSVLDRYGTLAAKKGEWSLARKVFELALSKDPHHPTLQHKLLQLLLHVGDIAAAKNLSNDFIHVNPYNKLAERILQGGEDRSETGACLFNLPPCHPPPLQPVTPRIFVDPPLEIVVETGTWAELLEKCAMLLQTSKTAFADVLFRFPATASDPEFPSSDAREEDQSEPVNGEAVLQAPNGTLKTGCIDLMEGAPENDSSKDEGKSNQMEDEEQDATSRRMTRSKRAQIAEAPLSGNQPDMEEDLQPESPSLLHLLKEYISSPSEEYASIFEMTESQDIKQTAVNDEGTNGSILHQRTKVKEHAVVMSQKMCVTEASIHILKSLLQPDALHGLLDAKFALLEVVVLLCRTHNNGRSRLSSCLSHHEILIISELFVDAAYQTRIARVGLSGKQSSKQPDGLKFNDLLDMATFWLFQYQLYEYDENEKSSLDISYQIRFWWAQGRYFEAKNVPTEALRAYQICLGQLEESGMSDVLVNHNVTDKTVNRREILEKLQVVQLYDVFEHANAAAQKFAWLEVKSILSPVLFSGDQKEAYMAAVDPNVWREALGVLLNASKGLGDCVLAFRCYLRLLHHRLPPLPTDYKRLFRNEEERNAMTIKHNLAIPE